MLGHALNIDPTKWQTTAEIEYEGAHRFSLYLPALPKNAGPPPEPDGDPEPVNPATRIVADPSNLAGDAERSFLRVVDLWPERVEMISKIDEKYSRLIILSDIDPAKGTANLFMTRAADAASLDLRNIYQGRCTTRIGPVRKQTDARSKRQHSARGEPQGGTNPSS